ncbi:SAF domain-containing protein [Actinotalea sp.]|uniref:SAF domain-containing protein n=1 Tax=Actinotalea sp. TaxID=1872145 RepID=UPI002CA8D5C7|nr:SAF domain-containing protein [Actinotalea sp.]HRA50384.1 SAF domain-containing protein [Actinotalea sp.]
MARHPTLLALRIAAWRARPLGVLLLVGVTVGTAVHLAVPPTASVPVVVTARSVPAGQLLTATDLRVASLPVGLVPGTGHRTADPLVGRAPVVDLPAGLPVVDAVLAGERFTLEPPAGTVVVAVSLTAAGLLVAGDRVDLVAPSAWADGGAEAGAPAVLATAALVLDVDRGPDASVGGLLTSGAEAEPRVLVAVTPDEGRRIAAVWDGSSLGAVLVG